MNNRILIADRDRALLDVYRLFFNGCGYDVWTATDGLDCLDKIRRQPPRLLVLEREIPWGGGDGVAALIEQERSLPAIPVVLVTGEAPPDEISEWKHGAVVSCFRKPFRFADLREVITRIEDEDSVLPADTCDKGNGRLIAESTRSIAAPAVAECTSTEVAVLQSVENRLANCPYPAVYNKVDCEYDDGTLTLGGCVPSFYLEQMLLEFVRGIDHVDRVVNNVGVVSATGLSSARVRRPR